jgi:folate-binding protein YgfZ
MNTTGFEWFKLSASASGDLVWADEAQQCAAVLGGSVISPLSGLSLLQVSGEDALTFLQGQLSSDVRELNGQQAQYSSYSNAKGRVLASFLLWKSIDEYYFIVSSDIAQAICKRLSMYIMRSRVKLIIRSDYALLGLNGPAAEQWLAGRMAAAPEAPLALLATEGGMCLRLPGGGLLLAQPVASIEQGLGPLPPDLVPVAYPAWTLLDIAAGIPWIDQSTQEQFVAQMINMDLIGAVSFTKGCYPGQEIIARTRYLGKVKRRMAQVSLPGAANNGDPLYSPLMGEQAIGMLVNVARASADQYRALAVVQTAYWESGVFLDRDNQLPLEKLTLPYSVLDE